MMDRDRTEVYAAGSQAVLGPLPSLERRCVPGCATSIMAQVPMCIKGKKQAGQSWLTLAMALTTARFRIDSESKEHLLKQ